VIPIKPFARFARAFLFTTTLFSVGPALADHMGPSGFGSGGGMTVFGADTLDGGHWAAGFRLAYTKPEQRSEAELQALAAQGIGAHNTDYNLNASLGLSYGVSHHLTVSAQLPYVRRDNLREGTGEGVERLGTVSGIGDLSVLAKYRLTEGEGPAFALIAGMKMPTGATHRHSPDGERLETEHQPGSGSWDPIFGVAGSLPLGGVQLAASALYQISTEGAQQTRLGDRLQGGIALSHHFGSRAALHHDTHDRHHGDELDEHADAPPHSGVDGFIELAGEWEGRQRIGGEVEEASGGKWAYVAPGVRFSIAMGWSVSAAVAVPVWQEIRASHPNNRYRLMLSLGRGF
jgi:hypothetical protein